MRLVFVVSLLSLFVNFLVLSPSLLTFATKGNLIAELLLYGQPLERVSEYKYCIAGNLTGN